MVNMNLIESGKYPSGLHVNESTSCEEFSRFARFNPYSVLSDEWMVFYYWGPPQTPIFAKFRTPRPIVSFFKQLFILKMILEKNIFSFAQSDKMTKPGVEFRHSTSYVLKNRVKCTKPSVLTIGRLPFYMRDTP